MSKQEDVVVQVNIYEQRYQNTITTVNQEAPLFSNPQHNEKYIDEESVKLIGQKLSKNQHKLVYSMIDIPFFYHSVIFLGILVFSLQSIFHCALNIVFGVLFILFTYNDQFNDGCSNDQFKKWGVIAAILNFILLGVYVIGQVWTGGYAEDSLAQRRSKLLINLLNVLIGIGVLVVSIGLAVTDDSNCAQLHKLSMAYYIISFISIGLLFLLLCCYCLKRV